MKTSYTKKIKTPVYKMKGVEPPLSSLVDPTAVIRLKQKIQDSKVPSDIKVFLMQAATRHYVFDYEKIAEYYAHAPKDVQELFEDSALVIVDLDKAIESGWVEMNKRLMEIRAAEPES